MAIDRWRRVARTGATLVVALATVVAAVVVAVAPTVVTAPPAEAAGPYTATVLGSVVPGLESSVLDANEDGVAIGRSVDAGGTWREALFRGGAATALPHGPFTDVFPRGINAAGTIVGDGRYLQGGEVVQRVLLWSSPYTSVLDLGTFGFASLNAPAINDLGQIVVWSAAAPAGSPDFVVFTPGAGLVTASYPGRVTPYAISNRGVVAGTLGSGSTTLAFVWTPTTGIATIPPLSGSTECEGLDVNYAGAVVGYCELGDGTERPFRWEPGTGTVDLGLMGGTSAQAVDINDQGEIVGRRVVAGARRGYVRSATGALADLPPGSGTASTPNVITNTGHVYGQVGVSTTTDQAARWSPAAGTTTANRYTPVVPRRLLDSRDGTGGHTTPWSSAEVRPLKVTGGTTTVPTDATSVVVNVTATGATGASHLTVFPTGVEIPTASNLNVGPGMTVPNLVMVKVGDDGFVNIRNNAATVHVIVDVVGYYRPPSGDRFEGVVPRRLLDSRDGTGGFATPWPGGTAREVTVRGGTTTVPADATAVVLNVTVTNTQAASHLTVFPSGGATPTASNLNFTPGQTVANLVVVGVGAGGKVTIYNQAGRTDVIADVVGYFAPTAPAQFSGVTPNRILDSRDGTGGFATPWPAGASRDLAVTGGATTVPSGSRAVVLNVTVTGPSAATHLTIHPAGSGLPTASNLNVAAGRTVANLVVVRVDTGGRVSIFNNAGTAHVIADVVGYYY